jgi:hypothetical protein
LYHKLVTGNVNTFLLLGKYYYEEQMLGSMYFLSGHKAGSPSFFHMLNVITVIREAGGAYTGAATRRFLTAGLPSLREEENVKNMGTRFYVTGG